MTTTWATIPGGSGVDDSVLSIVTAYDDLGRVRLISSYSYVSGVGDPVNQIEHVFDGWGNLAVEYQSHDAEVDEETTPAVQYTYADGADENGRAAYMRLTDISYPNDPNGASSPNGQNVHYNYSTGAQAAVDEIMSRLSSISDSESGEIDAAYTYLGAGTIAVEDYAQSQVKLDYDPDGDGSFSGLDRFGRVVDQVWEQYHLSGGNEVVDGPVDEYVYVYDRAGNRVSKTNELDHDLDETYVYDNVDRLTEWYVGDSETPSETWTLDALGNNLGAGSYNAANEETPTAGQLGLRRRRQHDHAPVGQFGDLRRLEPAGGGGRRIAKHLAAERLRRHEPTDSGLHRFRRQRHPGTVRTTTTGSTGHPNNSDQLAPSRYQ